jgi:hypothetical protein
LAAIPIYTEKQAGTCQSIPDIETKDGDFFCANLSITSSNQASEGVVEQRHVTIADEVEQNDTDGARQQPIAETTPDS